VEAASLGDGWEGLGPFYRSEGWEEEAADKENGRRM
jgi:hypothetical protein